MTLEEALTDLKATPEHAAGEAKLATLDSPPPPSEEIIDAGPDVPPSLATLPGRKACRHCGADFAADLKVCPACGKSQRGRPAGTAQKPRAEKAPPPPPLDEKQVFQLESALADTFEFALEDVAAPIMFRARGIPTENAPKLGEKRAAKLGAVWAPLLAPYMSARLLVWVLVIVVTIKALGSYFRECHEAMEKHEVKTP